MDGPSGGGTTVVEQKPPQLIPEGKEGYEKAQLYYQNLLENPPVYGGPRVAPINPSQNAYMRQARGYFGRRQPYQTAGENELYKTISGGYLYDPNQGYGYDPREAPFYLDYFGKTLGGPRGNLSDISALEKELNTATLSAQPHVTASPAAYKPGPGWEMPDDETIQKWVGSAIDPYMRRLEEQTLPELTSTFGISAGGVNNTRELAEKTKALDQTSQIIATDVLAPIYNNLQTLDEHFKNAERDRNAAIASGDADRATRASEAMAEISYRREQLLLDAQNQRDIARSQISTQGNIAGAGLENERVLAGASNVLQATEGAQNRVLQAEEGEATRRLGAWNAERERMTGGVPQVSQMLQSEMFRQAMLQGVGEYEKALNMERINAGRELFEEPIFRQSGAANALLGAAGVGPGGSTVTQNQSSSDTMGDLMSLIQTGAMVAAIALK